MCFHLSTSTPASQEKERRDHTFSANDQGKNTEYWPWCLLLLSHFSRVRLCATPYTAAHQGPPSLGFSRQKHWSGLPRPMQYHCCWMMVCPAILCSDHLMNISIFGSLFSQTDVEIAKILKIIAKHWELKNQGFILTMEVQTIVVMILN